jgi:hypothetical protein
MTIGAKNINSKLKNRIAKFVVLTITVVQQLKIKKYKTISGFWNNA